MIFKDSHLFIYFFILPIVILVMIFSYYRRKKLLGSFIDPALWGTVFPHFSYSRRFWKRILFFLGLLFICVAMLRPQYGLKFNKVTRKGQTILIALDTSFSMAAQDIKPSRFDHAKREILNLIDSLKGDKVGLLAFSGDAMVQCPLTLDYGALRLFLEELRIGAVAKPGTNLERAVKEAIRHFDLFSTKQKILILISDGESFDTDISKISDEAKKEGISIYTVGIGTPEGELLPVRNEQGIVTHYKKDTEKQVVVSRLDETSLRTLADTTGGAYFLSSDKRFVMDDLYGVLSSKEKALLEEKMFQSYFDRYQWFLSLAFLFLFFELFINERRRRLS